MLPFVASEETACFHMHLPIASNVGSHRMNCIVGNVGTRFLKGRQMSGIKKCDLVLIICFFMPSMWSLTQCFCFRSAHLYLYAQLSVCRCLHILITRVAPTGIKNA